MLRDTHESRTDPEARLYRKCNAGAAEPSYLGHVLTENMLGLIVGACVTEAGIRDGSKSLGNFVVLRLVPGGGVEPPRGVNLGGF